MAEQPTDAASISDWLSNALNLKQKYIDWNNQVGALAASQVDAAKYPQLAQERTALLQRAGDINSKISSTISAIESTYKTVSDYLSSIGQMTSAAASNIETFASHPGEQLSTFYSNIKDVLGFQGLGNLGFLPVLIPVAVIASAVAAIAYWTTDYMTLQTKVSAIKDLTAKGMTPAQAAATVNKTYGSGGGITAALENIKGIVIGLGVIGLGYVAYTRLGKKKGA